MAPPSFNPTMCFKMEDQEWQMLLALRAELQNHLMAYDTEAQEKFTELLVKSLVGKGNTIYPARK